MADVDQFEAIKETLKKAAAALRPAAVPVHVRGMRPDKPPENWLYKAWDGDVMVDLIFSPSGETITDENFERADELEVNAVRMKVASLEDVIAAKLLALGEHEADYGPILEMTRAIREQVDWAQVRDRTAASPFAKAFFTLVEELGIVRARATS